MTPRLNVRRGFWRHPSGDRDAVRDASLCAEPGEILAIVGPNGAGKSTLLAGMSGGLQPRRGWVLLDESDLYAQPVRERARVVARLPQSPACPEGLSVEALVRTGRHAHRSAFAGASADDRRAVEHALDAMDLLALRSRPVGSLSGGEQRRAWLALTLAQEARILLLDEPTTALDLRHALEVCEQIRRINARGVSVVLSLHDLEEAARIAHRVAVLHRGRLYAAGAPEAVLSAETLRDVFEVDAQLDKTDGQLGLRVHATALPERAL
ncbi:MAG: ABC transporter ATP-binding protein [Proteobacteria bacterium]|nr:ABC transporter ATP-binding protein [Pseudomonadota bacterium]